MLYTLICYILGTSSTPQSTGMLQNKSSIVWTIFKNHFQWFHFLFAWPWQSWAKPYIGKSIGTPSGSSKPFATKCAPFSSTFFQEILNCSTPFHFFQSFRFTSSISWSKVFFIERFSISIKLCSIKLQHFLIINFYRLFILFCFQVYLGHLP